MKKSIIFFIAILFSISLIYAEEPATKKSENEAVILGHIQKLKSGTQEEADAAWQALIELGKECIPYLEEAGKDKKNRRMKFKTKNIIEQINVVEKFGLTKEMRKAILGLIEEISSKTGKVVCEVGEKLGNYIVETGDKDAIPVLINIIGKSHLDRHQPPKHCVQTFRTEEKQEEFKDVNNTIYKANWKISVQVLVRLTGQTFGLNNFPRFAGMTYHGGSPIGPLPKEIDEWRQATYKEWFDWYNANKDKLTWNKEKKMFEIVEAK